MVSISHRGQPPAVIIFCIMGVLSLQACASKPLPAPVQLPPQIVVQTRLQFPPAPPVDNLTCDAEPLAPMALTDSELAQWAETVRNAGGTCRAKLDSVRTWIAGWPR
jgi:hypothetical protein